MKAPRKTTTRPVPRRPILDDASKETPKIDVTKDNNNPKIETAKETITRPKTPISFDLVEPFPEIADADVFIEFDWILDRSPSPYDIYEEPNALEIQFEDIF